MAKLCRSQVRYRRNGHGERTISRLSSGRSSSSSRASIIFLLNFELKFGDNAKFVDLFIVYWTWSVAAAITWEGQVLLSCRTSLRTLESVCCKNDARNSSTHSRTISWDIGGRDCVGKEESKVEANLATKQYVTATLSGSISWYSCFPTVSFFFTDRLLCSAPFWWSATLNLCRILDKISKTLFNDGKHWFGVRNLSALESRVKCKGCRIGLERPIW